MISLKITNIKKFMSELLVGNTFDFLSVYEISLSTFNTFSINGHINKNYYTKEEFDNLSCSDFATWPMLKTICYELIKGTKTPDKFKITFCMQKKDYDKIISKCQADLLPDNINGLYVHFIYENSTLTVITATSLSIFTMDKTLDKYWDDTIRTFLLKHFDLEEN